MRGSKGCNFYLAVPIRMFDKFIAVDYFDALLSTFSTVTIAGPFSSTGFYTLCYAFEVFESFAALLWIVEGGDKGLYFGLTYPVAAPNPKSKRKSLGI